MKIKTLLVAASLTALAAGCQMGRRHTPGEQIIMSAPRGTSDTTVATAPTPPPPAPSDTAAAPAPTVTEPAPVAVTPAPATTPVSTAPIDRTPPMYVAADADEAARFRNWPPVVNQYANGDVVAGPAYRITAPPPRSDRWDDVYAVDLFETALSFPQIVGTPIWMLITPPWTPVVYHGEQYPPSYTVDDPLPYYENEKVPGMIQMKRDK
ncbi:MAG: hypothetical protein JWN40_5600 [Phycisphaerales bacterium]|nr:hypothetical protein [Phycisphaerales bacterium]